MECLLIPLYSDNSTIASGPKNGAMFAAYISSSIADSLINSGLFSSFDEILQSETIFFTIFNESSYSFSINNIYLNNDTNNWKNKDDIEYNLFHNHFSVWNKDAIFSYCPRLIRSNEQILLSADIREGYGNLDYLSKSAIKSSSKDISITLHHNNDEDTFVSPSFSKLSLSGIYGAKQVLLLILLLIAFALVAILSFVITRVYRSRKLILLLATGIFSVLFITEIIKTLIASNITVYSIFNSIGNVLLIATIGLFLCLIIVRGRRDEIVNENNFHSISI